MLKSLLFVLLLAASLFAQSIETCVPTVPPMLQLNLHQKAPWNQYCPADSNGFDGHVPVGCVPVAMVQIMHYYRSPARGYKTAETNSLYGLLTVDIGDKVIQWNEPDDIAWALYAVGVSLGANYGQSGIDGKPNPRVTSTNIGAVPFNSHLYWNYGMGGKVVNRKKYADQNELWHRMIQDELLAGHPVLYGGGGHAFVIDGLNLSAIPEEKPEYHVNWGAGGAYNGWYDLDDLTPGSFDFTTRQHYVTRLQPRLIYIGYPYDEIEGVPYKFTPFVWHDYGDYYTLQISQVPQFFSPMINLKNLEAGFHLLINELEPDKTYWWRVYTYGGESPDWSRIHQFTTAEE